MTKKTLFKVAVAATIVAAGACAVVIAAKCLEDAEYLEDIDSCEEESCEA